VGRGAAGEDADVLMIIGDGVDARDKDNDTTLQYLEFRTRAHADGASDLIPSLAEESVDGASQSVFLPCAAYA
jgi:hypothetical protein